MKRRLKGFAEKTRAAHRAVLSSLAAGMQNYVFIHFGEKKVRKKLRAPLRLSSPPSALLLRPAWHEGQAP
jgi:hypothetical protein